MILLMGSLMIGLLHSMVILRAYTPGSSIIFPLNFIGGGKCFYINHLINVHIPLILLIYIAILVLVLLLGLLFQTLYIRRLHQRMQALQEESVSESQPDESSLQEYAELISPPETDEEFMAAIQTIAEEHLREAEWKIDHFAASLRMSRTVFYARMKQLTGQTPLEYLREIRLLRAKALLEAGGESVTAVAFETGFSDPKYFSKCFKKRFGCLPSEIRA